MNAFWQGVNFGFANSMLNGMFGCFGGFNGFGFGNFGGFGFGNFGGFGFGFGGCGGFGGFGFGNFGFGGFGCNNMFNNFNSYYSYNFNNNIFSGYSGFGGGYYNGYGGGGYGSTWQYPSGSMMKAPSWNSGSSFNIGGGSWSMPSSAGGGGYSWTVSSNNPGMHSLGGDCWQFNTTNYVKARDYVEGRTGTNNAPPAKPINYNAEALMKTWSEKSKRVTQAFCNRVIQAAQKIKCDPNDLMALMYGESGFNHRVVNGIDAVGLIQFMPQTRKGLGVTKEQLINMSMVQQMDYVEKCLLKSKRMAGFSDDHVLTGGEIGALTFLPAYAKRDVLTRRGEKYYRYNSGLDWNKDGVITKDDLGRRLKSFYA